MTTEHERDRADPAKELAAAHDSQIVGSERSLRDPAEPCAAAPNSGAAPVSPDARTHSLVPPGTGAVAGTRRPRDDQLIAAVALAFDVNADIARRWLVEAFASDRREA